MPSTATITAYYSFTANTKARASYVNTNFSNYRGHVIPIEPLTATANNLSYDLGSSEYRWKSVYCRDIDFRGSTTTAAQLVLSGDTSASNKAMLLSIDSVERYRFGQDKFVKTLNTTTAYSESIFAATTILHYDLNKFHYNIPTTTGSHNFLIAGVTIASLKQSGFNMNGDLAIICAGVTTTAFSSTVTKALKFERFTPRALTTTCSSVGEIAIKAGQAFNSLASTINYTDIANSTLTIITSGHPIEINMSARIYVQYNSFASTDIINASLVLVRSSAIKAEVSLYDIAGTTTSYFGPYEFAYAGGGHFIENLTAGTYIYTLRYRLMVNSGATTTAYMSVNSTTYSVKELFV